MFGMKIYVYGFGRLEGEFIVLTVERNYRGLHVSCLDKGGQRIHFGCGKKMISIVSKLKEMTSRYELREVVNI